MKQGSRIAAFDESFSRSDSESLVIGMIGRMGSVEGVLSFRVRVDGTDATDGIIKAIVNSRFNGQVKAAALNGITLAGLNVIDIEALRKRLRIPVIAITRKRPRRSLLRLALRKRGRKECLSVFERNIKDIRIANASGYHVQYIGRDYDDMRGLVEESTSLLRLAHMTASGVRHGESKGRV